MWTWIWLTAQSLYGLVSAYAFTIMLGMPGETPFSEDAIPAELQTSDLLQLVTAALTLLAFAVSGFLILKWIYRVNSNAHVYSSEMKVSPGWNVGFFFVPIANLWKPFQGIRETWEVSTMHGWDVPGWVRWWWGLWLASNFLGNASFRVELGAETIQDMMVAAFLDTVSAIVGIPVALLLIRLIRTLTAAQEAMRHGETFA